MPQEPTLTVTIRPETACLLGELGQRLRLKRGLSERASDADLIHKAVRHVVLRLRKTRASPPGQPRP